MRIRCNIPLDLWNIGDICNFPPMPSPVEEWLSTLLDGIQRASRTPWGSYAVLFTRDRIVTSDRIDFSQDASPLNLTYVPIRKFLEQEGWQSAVTSFVMGFVTEYEVPKVGVPTPTAIQITFWIGALGMNYPRRVSPQAIAAMVGQTSGYNLLAKLFFDMNAPMERLGEEYLYADQSRKEMIFSDVLCGVLPETALAWRSFA